MNDLLQRCPLASCSVAPSDAAQRDAAQRVAGIPFAAIHFATRLGVTFLFVACLLSSSEVRADASRPNILFMFTDDQPQNCLGIMGNADIQTPHLDELARRGTLFNNAFVTTAICCSNRACILTGQHMGRHGITDFQTPLTAEAFAQTYPAILRQSGYRTGYLGKYAVGKPQSSQTNLALPEDQFDLWYGFPQSISFRQSVDGKPRYLTEVMTEKAIEFLRASKDGQPFCLTVAFKEPHGPFNYFDPNTPNPYKGVRLTPSPTFTQEAFDAQPDFIRQSLNGDSARKWLADQDSYQNDLRTFYRTVTRADQAVGQIIDELKTLGMDDNTVILFSSDHGSLLGDHGLAGKWLMYENSIRVPMIIYDPRVAPEVARRATEEMVLSIDLAPTMLDIAGLEVPESMQGKTMMPIVRKESIPWRSHFYYQHTYTTETPRSPIAITEGIRTDRWKYIRYPEVEPVFEQLFDLQADPWERTNLVADAPHAAVLKTLREKCNDPQVAGGVPR